MDMSTFVNIEDETENAGMIKKAILDKMLKDKVISKPQYKMYNEGWQFIVIKRSWFKQLYKKLTTHESEAHYYKLVNFMEST